MGTDLGTTTVLRSVKVLNGQEDAYCDLWEQEVTARRRHGFDVRGAFMETGPGIIYRPAAGQSLSTGEHKTFTSLYSFAGDIDASESRLQSDPEFSLLSRQFSQLVVDGGLTRRVRTEQTLDPSPVNAESMVIMRRYQIVGDWNEFLQIWRRIVPLRASHGFPCLFAMEDLEAKVLTWAFSYDGDDFETFLGQGQASYYGDPQRVELETVNAYLEEVRLTPARQLTTPVDPSA